MHFRLVIGQSVTNQVARPRRERYHRPGACGNAQPRSMGWWGSGLWRAVADHRGVHRAKMPGSAAAADFTSRAAAGRRQGRGRSPSGTDQSAVAGPAARGAGAERRQDSQWAARPHCRSRRGPARPGRLRQSTAARSGRSGFRAATASFYGATVDPRVRTPGRHRHRSGPSPSGVPGCCRRSPMWRGGRCSRPPGHGHAAAGEDGTHLRVPWRAYRRHVRGPHCHVQRIRRSRTQTLPWGEAGKAIAWRPALLAQVVPSANRDASIGCTSAAPKTPSPSGGAGPRRVAGSRGQSGL